MDVAPQRARALADRLDVPRAGDYEAVLSDPDIDLVYVALPPTFHAEWATRALRAGIVFVNTFDSADITVPFGGYKQSGFGRDKSLHALDGYTQLKTTWIDLT